MIILLNIVTFFLLCICITSNTMFFHDSICDISACAFLSKMFKVFNQCACITINIMFSHVSTCDRGSWTISRQRPIEAYDIPNRSASYRAQSYDQNKPLFDSITSKMTASQVKNRKSKFFALTQAKIDDETKVHQRRRKNHQFRQ